MNEQEKSAYMSEISGLTSAQIDERIAALDEEVRSATEPEAVDICAEKKQMLFRQRNEAAASEAEAAASLEKRKTGVLAIRAGAGSVVERQEEGNNMDKRTFEANTPEYREAYFKHLMGRSLDEEERAAVVATAAIPTQTLNKIVARLKEAPLLKRVTLLSIPGFVTIPREKTVNNAAWVEMPTAATDSSDEIESVTLGAYKLIKTLEITADVERMSIDAFEEYIVNRLVNKMEAAIQAAILNGTGTNQPTGILKSGEVDSANVINYTKAALTYADVTSIMGKLDSAYHKDAVWSIPAATFFSEVLGMVDSNKRPIVVLDPQAGGAYRLMGHPVELVDDAADTIVFGDFSAYHFNLGDGIEVKKDESVAFRSGSVVYRAMALCDGKNTDKAAFVVATKATA